MSSRSWRWSGIIPGRKGARVTSVLYGKLSELSAAGGQVAVAIPALASLAVVSAVCCLMVAYEALRYRADRRRVRHPDLGAGLELSLL